MLSFSHADLSFLFSFEDFLWSYFGFPILVILGLYFSFKTGFVQIRKLPYAFKHFIACLMGKGSAASCSTDGVHPLKAFFAAVGGCVGIGNIVGICTAVQIGGPGALFWVWVTAALGMMIKYAEVYLGIKYRIKDENGHYHGGPMYFLPRLLEKVPAFAKFTAATVCILLCIYGIEIYQFSVITESLANNFGIEKYFSTAFLIFIVLLAVQGGLNRVGAIASVLVPTFVVMYVAMGGFVLYQNFLLLPSLFSEIFYSAFQGSAPIGGFLGSAWIVVVSQGIRRGSYTGDIGIGYASVLHSESNEVSAQKQASLVFVEMFLDTFVICTTSILLVLITGAWHQGGDVSMMVQHALATEFPFMEYFIPFFLFLLGYSTINSYLLVGIKCAERISKNHGRWVYILYAILMMASCSFVNTDEAQSIMMITAALLLMINCAGIFMLRKEISFQIDEDQAELEANNEPILEGK